jgi:HSP20 family protein
MTITRWIPKSSLITYSNELDRWLDSAFGPNAVDSEKECYFCPKVEIDEQEKKYLLDIELPGVQKKDITLKVEDNLLTIEGEKKAKQTSKSKPLYRSERSYGKFRRSFRLPREIDRDQVDATFKNGVLRIEIPKLEEALPKQIEVKVK